MTLDLVLWGERAGQPYAVGHIDPLTGEVLDSNDPASMAAWYLAYREFQETVCRPAELAALDRLNRALDASSKVQLDLPGGHVAEISGESQGAADGALAVTDAAALRDDLEMLASRGDMTMAAVDAAVKVDTVTTYKPDLRRLRSMREQADIVGETVRAYVVPQPRDRRRPTVKRIA